MRWFRLANIGIYYFLRRNIWNFLVIFAILGIAALGVWQSAVDNAGIDAAWSSGLWLNFATEMLGAVLTFAMFEILINANNRQEELIRQLRSSDNATALNALNELRDLGYLFDGTLEAANLKGANLANANFDNADLRRVNLTGANLEAASFIGTEFDRKTILPDGSYWSENSDLKRFSQASVLIKETANPRVKSHHSRQWRTKRPN